MNDIDKTVREGQAVPGPIPLLHTIEPSIGAVGGLRFHQMPWRQDNEEIP